MQKKVSVASRGISAEDSQLFRESITGAQPIAQDKIPPVAAPRKKKRRTDVSIQQLDENLFWFSDEFEGFVADGASLSWVQPGEDPHLAKNLKRGEFQPGVVLDLHGLSQHDAIKKALSKPKFKLAKLKAFLRQLNSHRKHHVN